jgi:hypothetical protein
MASRRRRMTGSVHRSPVGGPTTGRRPPRAGRAPTCQALEERRLLSTTYYVSNGGSNGNAGTTSGKPFQTIAYALTKIAAGDTVKIHTGTYREKVTLPYFTSMATTTVTTDGSGPVTISGADPFTGSWSPYTNVTPTAGGSVYAASYPGESPQEVVNGGQWLQEIGSEGTVYGDSGGGEGSNPQRIPAGSNSVASMVPGSFYFVPTAGASSGGRLYVDLPAGQSPAADVEISDRDGWVDGYTGSNQAHNYTINGLTFEYSNAGQDSTASSPIPPNSIKMGTNGLLENCTMLYADFGAVTMYSGDTVENCTIDYSGCYGIGTGGSCTGLTIADNTIDDNNYRHFNASWQAGGIKLIASGSGGSEVGKVYGNSIVGNFGSGVWSDSNTANTASTPLLIYDNYIADNASVPADYEPGDYRVGEAGVKIEVSTYVRVYNNLIVGNYPNGVLVSASQHTDVYNNTIVGNRGLAALWAGGTPRTLGTTGINEPLQYDDIENNLFYDNTATYDLVLEADLTTAGTVNAADNTSDHNLFFRFGRTLQLSAGAYGGGTTYTTLAAWTAASGHDADSLSADPHLLNPAAGNYELGANSPAIGKGATLDLNGDGNATDDTDYTGTAVRTVPFDIGAYKAVTGAANGITEPVAAVDPKAWVDDTLPTGAQVHTSSAGTGDGVWNWLSAATPTGLPLADVPTPAAESGFLSVIPEENTFSGVAAMSFEGATQTMAVTPDDDLYAYVYLDPTDRPAEVMVQWKAGSTWHRAYWGANDITSFTGIESDDSGGTTVSAGSLPTQSGWVRLEVPASEVNLNTGSVSAPLAVSGLSLDSYGGQAAWDDVGVTAGTPVAQWTVDEGTGTVAHDTYGYDNGTYVGNPQWGTGKSGGDVVLDGSGYVNTGSGPSLNLAATAANPAMSIVGWFDLADTGGGTYTALGADKKGSYRLVAYDADTYEDGAASRWQFYVTDSTGATHTCQSTTYYANDVWHYVVGTYDGDGHMSLYVDGQLAATTTWTGTDTLATTTNSFDIGRRDQIARYFPGQIDEVSLYDQALSAAQVTTAFGGYFAEPVSAPAAPTNLKAASASGTAALTWTPPAAPADDAVVYDVYRGTTPGGEAATPVAIGLTAAAYTDTGLTNGQAYYYKVVAINTGGASGTSAEATATPLPPPHVTAVLVDSTAWSAAFLNYLNASGLGVGGYAVPAGARQIATLPWDNINQVKVRFDEPVTIQMSSLALMGINVGSYAVASFSYDATTYTATWTLAAPVGADKLQLNLSDAVVNANGQPLDGEWTNGTSAFPSGGAAGVGNFQFLFDVLPGDVNQSGRVLGDDLIAVRNAQFASTASAGYWIYLDLDGSGQVLGNDLIVVRNDQFAGLPAGTF